MTPDEIDIHEVQIINSPDVRDWPATATLTKLEFRPNGLHVEHTKTDSWPNVTDETKWAPGDGVQYTVWLIAKINGRWVGSGGIEYWKGCDKNGGPPEEFGHNWYYAHDRWRELADYQPTTGEQVGFMVTAGDARDNGRSIVHERSNIVRIPFPWSGVVMVRPADAGGGTVLGGAGTSTGSPSSPSSEPPAAQPPPAPASPEASTDLATVLALINERFDRLEHLLNRELTGSGALKLPAVMGGGTRTIHIALRFITPPNRAGAGA